jgi:GTP-binding protein
MADVPGLIEGAAEGAGLGLQFLKHLQRTRLLLHLVDIAPIDEGASPVADFRAIQNELAKFSDDLSTKARWLVINKIDLMTGDQLVAAKDQLLGELDWDGPVYEVSAVTGEGTEALGQAVVQFLERRAEAS